MKTRCFVLVALAIVFVCAPALATEQYIFVANYASNSLTSFTPDPSGALMLVEFSVPTGAGPYGLAVNSTGQYLYVGNTVSGDVSAYRIEDSGVLTSLAQPFPVGPRPFSVAVDASSRFLYAGLEGQARIAIFSLNADGSLSNQIGSISTLEAPRAVTVTPDGRFLYVANSNGRTVGAYRIEADGLLTHVSETPAGDHPFYIALDPAGKFLYSVDYTAMQVFAFSIGGDGTLTQLGSPLPCGQHPGFAAVDPQGKLLYVGGQDGRVFVYSIQADGSLAAAVSPPLQPRYFLEPAAVVFDPTGPFAYIADRAGYDVVAASVASNGELSPIRGYVTGGAPIAMATNACAIGPAITGLRADPEFLWPPNHAMTPVSILYDVADQCGPASCSLTVKSNEPESENPHDPDWVILGSHELLLRAEKAAAGGGREYDIAVTCGDARNNTRSAVTQVVVPRDQGMPQMPRRLNNIPGR